jgi:hypothetical protein
LNEVEVNTPSGTTERCEYVEIIGAAGTQVPANTFFVSVDGDSGQHGLVSYVKNLGGVTFGSNGTITIINGQGLNCPSRTYPAGTTLVTTTSVAMGFGAESFLLIGSTNPTGIFEGNDLDADDNGVFDVELGITVLDGIGWTPDPLDTSTFQLYGGVPDFGGDGSASLVPDAASRFTSNSNAFSGSAWYYGHLTGAENAITYQLPGSFPTGAALTPGDAPNSH